MTFFAFAKGRKDPPPPDPGKYNVPGDFGGGPKFSFRSRHKEFQKDYNPDYAELPSTLSKKGCTIGPRLKPREPESITAGPSYNASTIGDGRKSSFHIRPPIKFDDIPGPGRYEPAPLNRAPAYTCGVGKRFNFIQDHTIVPPGAYEIPSSVNEARPMTISTRKREGFQRRTHPGPIYNTQPQTGVGAPRFSFPRGPRDIPIEQTPGPADYQQLEPIGNKTAIPKKIRSRTAVPKEDRLDAPYYNIGTTIKPIKRSLGVRPPTSYETISPGPIYDIGTTVVQKKKKERTFGIRTEMKDPHLDVPSPDSYWMAPITPLPPPIVGMTGPTDRAPVDLKKEAEKPGPGYYDTNKPTIEPGKRGYKFTSRNFDEYRPDTAAPYHPTSSTLGGPMYTIGAKDA